MANTLETQQTTEAQAGSKIATIQTALDQTANAINAVRTIDVTAGNVVLVANDVYRYGKIQVIGATTAGRTVTWPATEARINLVIVSDPANTQNFSLVNGTTTHVLAPNTAYLAESTGAANHLVVRLLTGTAGSDPESIMVALSDETTALTTGLAKLTCRIPYKFAITAVRANLNTVSSSGIVTVDVNKNGVSIFSTLLTIDVGEKTSVTAAVPAVLSTTSLSDDDELTFDIDVAGTGAKGLKVSIIGTREL